MSDGAPVGELAAVQTILSRRQSELQAGTAEDLHASAYARHWLHFTGVGEKFEFAPGALKILQYGITLPDTGTLVKLSQPTAPSAFDIERCNHKIRCPLLRNRDSWIGSSYGSDIAFHKVKG